MAKEEADRQAKEEADRMAKEEADRKAKEEGDRKAKEEADRKAKEEADRKAKEEADRKAKEEADRKAKEEDLPRQTGVADDLDIDEAEMLLAAIVASNSSHAPVTATSSAASSVPRPPSGDVDELLQQALEGVSGSPGARHPAASHPTVPGQRLLKPHSELSLEEEGQVLSAILAAVTDQQSSVSAELDGAQDVEAVLDHAERVASSSAVRHRGLSVLHTHEHHQLKEELKKARGSGGWPTCIAVNPDPGLHDGKAGSSAAAIAVGTTLGLVLLLERRSKLCGVLGNVATGTESKGSVSSLAFSVDGALVVSGFEKGQLDVWDSVTMQLLRHLSGEFDTPVLRCMFLNPNPSKVVAMDCNSGIRLFTLSKIMSKMVSRSTSIETGFDSPATDIAVVAARPMQSSGGATSSSPVISSGNPQWQLYYLAAVTSDCFSVYFCDLGIQNEVDLAFHHKHVPQSPLSNELVQWVEHPKFVNLCVSWVVAVDVWRLVSTSEKTIDMALLAQVKVAAPIRSMSRLSGLCLLLLDENEMIHVFDSQQAAIVEDMKLVGFEPVTFSSRQCGQKHFGAMTAGFESAMLLGRSSVLSCSVLPWEARLDALVVQKKFLEAFELAKGFALEVAVAMVGFHHDPTQRRKELHTYIIQLITAFISDFFRKQSKKPDGKDVDGELLAQKAQLRAQKEMLAIVLAFCADIDAGDILFGPIATFLTTLKLRDVLLICLEKEMLSGKLGGIPEHFLHAFVDLFRDPARMLLVDDECGTKERYAQRAELALMALSSGYETLQQIALENHMVKLSCSLLSFRRHLHAQALEDTILVSVDTALEYVECTLNGMTLLPEVPLQSNFLRMAKRQVLECLLKKPFILSQLAKHDVGRVLAAIRLSLADTLSSASPWDETLRKVQVADALFNLLVDPAVSPARPWELERRPWPPFSAVTTYYKLVAKEVASGQIIVPDPQALFERINSHMVYHFQKTDNAMEMRETQDCLGALYRSAAARAVVFTGIETELRSKKLGRTVAVLLAAKRDFAGAIDCYLDRENAKLDPHIVRDVFTFISDAVASLNRTNDRAALEALRHAVKGRIERLVEVDATALAQFVFEHLPGDHSEVIGALRGSKATFLRYLKELIAKGDPSVETPSMQNTFIELLCEYEPSSVYPYLSRCGDALDYDLQVVLEAVKKFRITDATIFLLEKTDMVEESMVILMAAVTKAIEELRAELISAIRSSNDALSTQMSSGSGGGFNGSFTGTFTFSMLSGSFSGHPHGSAGGGDTTATLLDKYLITPEVRAKDAELRRMVDVGIDLCTRYHNRTTQAADNWFRLLDRFSRPKRILFDRQVMGTNITTVGPLASTATCDGFDDNEIELATRLEKASTAKAIPIPVLTRPLSIAGQLFLDQMQNIYSSYLSLILQSMVKVLDLATVIGKIVEDNERERFGPFKPIIVGILESLSFDLDVNRLCKACTDVDTVALGRELQKSLSGGLTPRSDRCGRCAKPLSEQSAEYDSLRFYTCGHGFHEACCNKAQECYQCAVERQGGRAAAAADSEPTTPARGKAAARVTGGEAKDVATMVRRLRFTRAKLDGAQNFRELLKSFEANMGNPTVDVETQKKLASKSLLLAPAPPEPISVGELRVGVLNLKAEFHEALTEDEIYQIFGDTSRSKHRQAAASHQSNASAVHDSNVVDDEEDFDLEAALMDGADEDA
jgi:hypothetical protein